MSANPVRDEYPPPGGYDPPQLGSGNPTALFAGGFLPPEGYVFSSAARGPITQQPGNQLQAWTPAPPQCPQGLEYLAIVDELLVTRKVELLELCWGLRPDDKYIIRDTMGRQVFVAVEDAYCCEKRFCYPSHMFEMKIFGLSEVIHLYRPLACTSGQSIDVFAPVGQLVGRVKQDPGLWNMLPSFSILNESGDEVLKIDPREIYEGYKILALGGEIKVGNISKISTGTFKITFQPDLDVKLKAVLLGAVILIDFARFKE